MQDRMREKTVVIGVILVLLVVVGIAMGVLWLGVQTGRAIEEQEKDDTETSYDARGFIGVCEEEECVTIPTLLEREGELWRLGFYEEARGADGESRLAYRNAMGKIMTVEAAFAR